MRRDAAEDGEAELGAHVTRDGVRFSVWSSSAAAIWVSIFDEGGEREVERVPLARGDGDVHAVTVPGLKPGSRYGYRADGEYDPARGLWFDPDKLLMDPYAVEVDRRYVYDARLAARRDEGGDTAALMPKAIVPDVLEAVTRRKPLWRSGGLIYELPVRAFTVRHPDIAPQLRGTITALAEPPVIEHLRRIGVTAVELMPVAAWIDERHLQPLGLTNAWGYNPVTFMPLDPRLAPGGLAELRTTVNALHDAGIGVILDVVFNHTGESDNLGPTLSLRGLDNLTYYRHAQGEPGRLVNDTGTGNTLDCDHPVVQRMVLDSLRHFVRHAGVDGFRFDLAPVLGRSRTGFDGNAALLLRIAADPEIGDRILVAEPWDIGPAGYQLGNFPEPFMEWNDRYRDDIRRFWRGDKGAIGALATRLAGSSDVFGSSGITRAVNFLAAHDGMTLADIVSYERKHNDANGEENRDGHGENLSWNNGVEGGTADSGVLEARRSDVCALLATLFASRGAIMLTAGDEFGRSQGGNNNAYAQDNEITWLDWERRDSELESHVARLSALRSRFPQLTATTMLTGQPGTSGYPDVAWLRPDGQPLTVADWENPESRCLAMLLAGATDRDPILGVLVNGSGDELAFSLPAGEHRWSLAMSGQPVSEAEAIFTVASRSVAFVERARGKPRRKSPGS
jgi:glycogen operon protein